MARIAVGGFQHETNTFAPLKAEWRYFVEGEGWPALSQGDALFDTMAGLNIPISGFISAARAHGHNLVPLAWASASPSAEVTEEAFENMAALLQQRLSQALNDGIDAVYLDLHGAMVAEHLEDGEGALLTRIRAQIGPDRLLVASLDFHANVTKTMVTMSDVLIGYRTYPHLDMAATGAKVADALDGMLSGRIKRPAKAFAKLPYLIPLAAQSTMTAPADRLFDGLSARERDGVQSVSFMPGFPPADIVECGPAVVVYGDDQVAADRGLASLVDDIMSAERGFGAELMAPAAATAAAMRLSNSAKKPVVLADIQDNPGAGGTSDTTGLLKALIDGGAVDAVIGLLCDPETAARAHEVGPGNSADFVIGGKLFTAGDPPYHGRFVVDAVSDGAFLCTGPFYGGTNVRLGPMAVLRAEGGSGSVRVVISSKRMQAADQAMFRHLGIDPTKVRILGLKSTVHFRGDFSPIAEQILLVEAPGAFIDRPDRLPYRRLRPGLRLMPNGQKVS